MSYELIPQNTGFLKPDIVSPFFPAQFEGIIRREDFTESIALINAALKPPPSMNKWYRLPAYIAALECVMIVIVIAMSLGYGSQTDYFGTFVWVTFVGIAFNGLFLCIPCCCALQYLGAIWQAYRKKALNAVISALNAQYAEHAPAIHWRLVELVTVTISSNRHGTNVSQSSKFKIVVEAIRPSVIVIVNNGQPQQQQQQQGGPYNEYGYQQPQQQQPQYAQYGNNYQQQGGYGGYQQQQAPPAYAPQYQAAIDLQPIGHNEQREGAFKGTVSSPKADNMKTSLLKSQDNQYYGPS